jgi:predicted HAD superfamily Cof-like phosphohydrolase
MSFTGDIEQFHRKFDLIYEGKPRVLPYDLGKFRIRFLIEETAEYQSAVSRAALDLSSSRSPDDQMAKALDALVDLVYVALGTAYLHGFDFNEAWRRVHEANMKKIRAADVSQSTRGSLHDVIKPPEWEPPSLVDLVSDNVYK